MAREGDCPPALPRAHGVWRSSERSEDPLQKKRADQAQCLVRKGGFSFMGRVGQEGARSAQEKFEQPILS